MLRNEGKKLKKVIVCSPIYEYFNVTDLKAQNMNEIADREKTQQQFNVLKSTIAQSGCEVFDVPELPNHPNSIFTRDVALSTPQGYIRLRMGLMARRGEEDWISDVLETLGEPCIGEITNPGTVEGGDIIVAGSVAFVGQSTRTNAEGVRQVSNILRKMNYQVRVAQVKDFSLHLGGMMSAIGPERILCCRKTFPNDYFNGYDTVEIDCNGPSHGNVICLDENKVIANSAENMETIKKLENNGVTVHAIDLSEFRKGAGGPTCLILPVERE